ncbi:serine/threonine-protein kinase-like protein At1g28390 [Mercurialis annua]|uniref:serine/threonine-protein kinase-like protein At1g28390 n=1 Tax=Mercurialis annua TaxID=3986 RepID=UPI00215E6FA9|nr:serine/threonine-protein kinase-like protein At1g28390 [Mercurialis annua]
MGYLSNCNADSAIATCDPYTWPEYRRSKRKNKPKTTRSSSSSNKPIPIRHFTYDQLVKAANGFSADSFLGKGSHGTVYKAVLDDGKLIAAVKKAYPNQSITIHSNHNCNSNINCSTCSTPAENEIEILSKIQHPRLVNLIGYCSDAKHHRKLLVVEYMQNGNLCSLLHSTSKPPGWTRRIRFALQVAKAVQALHTARPPIIHRDIKSSNVLIDEKMKARLGDFGLALRGHVEDVRVKCTPPAGTLGYLDPGYLAPGDISCKSDVFSFGILLLEIISGRNAIDVKYSPPSIVDWAVPLIKRGDSSAICDHRIGSPVDAGMIKVLSVLAARCVRSTAERRPGMGEVVEGLKYVNRRYNAPLLWNRLRRRVEDKPKFDRVVDLTEERVNVNKTVRNGSRRNSKVSSVEYGKGMIGERVMRSKSTGSRSDDYYHGRIKAGGGVAVKLPMIKLSKSRSVGVLQSPTVVQCSSNYCTEIESPFSKMLIGSDENSQLEMQGKPLIFI